MEIKTNFVSKVFNRNTLSNMAIKGGSNLVAGDRGGTVVKVLCHKSEGRWFDSRWCHWNFPIALWPWGRLSL